MVDLKSKFSLLSEDERQKIYDLVHGEINIYQENNLLILDNRSEPMVED